jgi:7-carboxy-7-deazaguanine synthase
MINEQVPVAAEHRQDATIDVHSIFKTIQGEGPFCGERALFIRLWGCNLRCPGCDTEYTSTRVTWTPHDLTEHVWRVEQWPHGALIVLTGGEPFRQNVVPTIYALISAGYQVQVETNGVIAPPGLESLDYFTRFTIVCSPKTSQIHPAIKKRAAAFKYVLRAGEISDEGLPLRALGHKATPHVARPRPGALVYVQPMDEGDPAVNELNLHHTIQSTMKHGYRLQIQVHKIIEME